MSQPNNFDDDRQQRLVEFLRLHRPVAPPPAINLQQSILNQITANEVKPQIKFRKLWLIPAAILSTLAIAWQVEQQMYQPVISEADRTVIEASLIGNWSAFIGEDTTEDVSSSYLSYSEIGISNE